MSRKDEITWETRKYQVIETLEKNANMYFGNVLKPTSNAHHAEQME